MHDAVPSEAEPVPALSAAAPSMLQTSRARPQMRIGVHLQRAAGNHAVTRILQRVSQAKALQQAADDSERANQLAAMSPVDLADTLLDPAAKALAGSAGLRTAVDALPAETAARIRAVLNAANGPWEEPFYYAQGLLDPALRDAIWEALKRTHPEVANPTARSAKMNSALSGYVKSDVHRALMLLNAYAMGDILNMLTYAEMAGLLPALTAGLKANPADVNGPRLEAAMLVVSTRPILTVLQSHGLPLTADSQAKVLKDLEDQAAEAETHKGEGDDAAKARLKNGLAAYRSARPQLDRLFVLLADEGLKGEIPAMHAYVNEAGIEGFRTGINDVDVFGQGQFVLSWAGLNKFAEVMNAQLVAFAKIDPKERGKLEASANGIVDVIKQAEPDHAADSYARVLSAVNVCNKAFQASAKANKVTLDPAFVTALKQSVPAPKKGEKSGASFEKAMKDEWRPLWKQWTDTKTLPDMSAESNAFRLVWLRMADKWACQPMTLKIAELYDAKAGAGNARVDPNDPAAAAKRKAAAIPFTTLYKGNLAKGATGTVVKGKDKQGHITDERVAYRTDLAAQIERIKTAIDLGWFIHVRALAGKAMDYTASRAKAEHSLLIVGYRGNAFFCADMDSAHEGSAHLVAGSTTLIYDAGGNTFATAAEAELAVDEFGVQKTTFHHRYQAWTIETK